MFADAHNDTLAAAFLKNEGLYENSLQFDFKRAEKVGLKLQYMAIWQDTRHKDIDFMENIFTILDLLNKYDVNNVGISKIVDENKLNILVTVEDISFINDIFDVEILKEKGVKGATLSWNHKNKLCGGAFEDMALSSFGKEVLKKLLEMNFIVDLAHASQRTFYDVVKIINSPFIVSHSNCYALCKHPRNLTDDQIKIVGSFNGLIGINFYSPFLNESSATLEDITKHIAYISELIGHKHVCLGSDFDGADNFAQGINGVEDLPKIKQVLESFGFSRDEIFDICYNNLLNFTRSVLK